MIKPLTLSGRGTKRALAQHAPVRYGTYEVAKFAGVSWRTVYRWLRAGQLPEPERAANGYRVWTPEAVAIAKKLGQKAVKYQRNKKKARSAGTK